MACVKADGRNHSVAISVKCGQWRRINDEIGCMCWAWGAAGAS